MSIRAACTRHSLTMPTHKALCAFPAVILLVLCLSGCGIKLPNLFGPDEPPLQQVEAGIAQQEGVITHISYAATMNMERQRGDIALTVELADGTLVVVAQPQDNIYTVGDRVRLVQTGKDTLRAQIVR